ncbi:metal-sensitive transcriptional regulator [Kitasatospora sp. NBC_00085]|uniref:metal-sensitive transcriptional regulator n=1 Tax=unclassified Kitasatospora TaxID=2633591 RepID=UPI0032501E27
MTTTEARTQPDHAPGAEPGGDQPVPAAAEAADQHADQHAGHGPHGYSGQKDAHLKRLRRIEGQIRGLQRMVDEDVYCIDVLTQVSASTKALQSFALSLLEEHLRHCVAAAAEEGGTELDAKVAEATAAIARLLRS